MLIGLLSDTHIPGHSTPLPPQLKEAFRGVELILHAGDVYGVSVLDELQEIAPVWVANGDDDVEILRDKRAKNRHILTVDGVTIWLTHIKPWPEFQDKKPTDVIVFGHTHQPLLETSGDILQVNPGSPTFPYYRHELGTVGLLTIDNGKAEARIIQLQNGLETK